MPPEAMPTTPSATDHPVPSPAAQRMRSQANATAPGTSATVPSTPATAWPMIGIETIHQAARQGRFSMALTMFGVIARVPEVQR